MAKLLKIPVKEWRDIIINKIIDAVNNGGGGGGVDPSILAKKADLVNGKIPASQLPSYVDDVIEYEKQVSGSTYIQTLLATEVGTLCWNATASGTSKSIHYKKFLLNVDKTEENIQIINPEDGKIYVQKSNNKTYRWSGSNLIEVSPSISIGETASTAFAGNRGVSLETGKADKATTLAGYGITDCYTKTEIEEKIKVLSTESFNRLELMNNSDYHKCDIIGSCIGGNPWSNEDALTVMRAYKEHESDEYLTGIYQIMLENLSENQEIKIVGCSDLNWYDGITHETSHTLDENYTLGYDKCDSDTQSKSYIDNDGGNIKLVDAVSKTGENPMYYKIVVVIPNNNWNNAKITITKETYNN